MYKIFLYQIFFELYTTNRYQLFLYANDAKTFTVSLSYRFKQGEKVDKSKRKKDINNNDNDGR